MNAELFSIKYADKHAAAIVYRKIVEKADQLGIVAYGLERYKTSSRRTRSNLKISLVLEGEQAKNLPSVLALVHNMISEHPLYAYLSLDYTAVPTSQTKWNFESYDDPKYQEIFIRKREKG
jgi:hypothetical protein